VLQQEVMIEKVRELSERDERVVATLMYGSFALGQGDRFSDIEFYLFFEDEVSEGLEEEAWVGQIAPLDLYYVNEFGNGIAIFEDLIRGEFHFEAASNVGLVDAWETAWFPSLESAVLVDKTGELSRWVSRLVRHPPDKDTPERRVRPRRGVLDPDSRSSAPSPAVGGRQERPVVEPHARARGRCLGLLLRTVQGVHGGTGGGAARLGLRIDLGVGPGADGRAGHETRLGTSGSATRQARPVPGTSLGTKAERPRTPLLRTSVNRSSSMRWASSGGIISPWQIVWTSSEEAG
jgi:hypothetical protein